MDREGRDRRRTVGREYDNIKKSRISSLIPREVNSYLLEGGNIFHEEKKGSSSDISALPKKGMGFPLRWGGGKNSAVEGTEPIPLGDR